MYIIMCFIASISLVCPPSFYVCLHSVGSYSMAVSTFYFLSLFYKVFILYILFPMYVPLICILILYVPFLYVSFFHIVFLTCISHLVYTFTLCVSLFCSYPFSVCVPSPFFVYSPYGVVFLSMLLLCYYLYLKK